MEAVPRPVSEFWRSADPAGAPADDGRRGGGGVLSGLDWLDIDYRTLFRLTAEGRIVGENDPIRSPGPRLWLGGCIEGNRLGVRADVDEAVAAELADLAASEPPFLHPAEPMHLAHYRRLLGEADDLKIGYGLIYELPHGQRADDAADLVAGDSARGRDLLYELAENGMPDALIDIGFISLLDFWAPWCAVLVDGEIASIAFPARLSKDGAELGLVTIRSFRGRGLGTAATAGWSRLEALQDRTLFYSTERANRSSQRVTERLGLRLRGASLRIM